jgi:spoIIIJ-associated protein
MQTIETTGKSVQEATEAAARKLGTSSDKLTVTVLEEHKGLFGKATVKIRAEFNGTPTEATAVVQQEVPAPKHVEPEPEPEPEPVVESHLEPETAAIAQVEEAEAPAAAPAVNVGVEASEEDGERMLGLLQEVLKTGDLEVTAIVTGRSGRYVNIELDGKDVAFLVGKHGEVLNALQYVINIISNQQYGNGIRATLDGNNYRNRREEALTKLATKIADQVKERGEEAVLDALPAFERRIVHKALSEYEGVATYSEGEEPNRRVVIAPAD